MKGMITETALAPFEQLLTFQGGPQELATFGNSADWLDLQASVEFEGYFPHDELIQYALDGALGFSFPNPIKAVESIGKGAVKGVKAAGRATAKAAATVGKGAIAAGKFTVKIGGKVVDVALMPFTVMLRISKKLANVLCAMPPATFAAAASAGSSAAGAPMNPQQSAQFRKVFCSVASALEKGQIKNARDLANFKKMLPVAMKVATEGAKVAQQQALQKVQQGMQQKLNEAQVPPEVQAAAQQMEGFAEIEALLDASANDVRNISRTMKTAVKQGRRAATQMLKGKAKEALADVTAEMTGQAAAGALEAKLPGFTARIGAQASVTPTSREKHSVRPARLVAMKAAIKRLESMGRKDQARKMRARLARESRGLSGATMPGSGFATGAALALGIAAVGTGVVFAVRSA